MYFKVAPNGWSDSIIFLNLPFINDVDMPKTFVVIYIISGIENKGDDPKGITLSKKLLKLIRHLIYCYSSTYCNIIVCFIFGKIYEKIFTINFLRFHYFVMQ